MVSNRVIKNAITRIEDYMHKHKDTIYDTYKLESTYQNKLLKVFRDLNLSEVMWWSKVSDRYIKGVPDIVCCVAGYFVAFELKRQGGKPSKLQLYNIKKITEAGGNVCITMDLASPLEVVRQMLKTHVSG